MGVKFLNLNTLKGSYMEIKVQIDFLYSSFLLNLTYQSLKTLIKFKEFVHFGLKVKLDSIVIKAPHHQT